MGVTMARAPARLLLALTLTLYPDLASACAVCWNSAYGNRGFSWAFVALMLAPFAVLAGLAGTLAYGYRRRVRETAARRSGHAGQAGVRPDHGAWRPADPGRAGSEVRPT